MENGNTAILSLSGVTKNFGGVTAVRDVTFDVAHGERRLIIGTNGAGKSTLFNLICGDLRVSSGSVALFGEDVTKSSMRQRASLGMRRTYQATALFSKLSVRENLFLALLGEKPQRYHYNFFTQYEDSAAYSDKIEKVAEMVLLGEKLDELVVNLSHGEHRQLELGVALIVDPQLLLLDEPSSGLSESERSVIKELLLALDKDMTLILVEHNMELAMSIASHVTVMQEGAVVFEGTPEEVQSNQYVQDIYLGTGGAANE